MEATYRELYAQYDRILRRCQRQGRDATLQELAVLARLDDAMDEMLAAYRAAAPRCARCGHIKAQ